MIEIRKFFSQVFDVGDDSGWWCDVDDDNCLIITVEWQTKIALSNVSNKIDNDP